MYRHDRAPSSSAVLVVVVLVVLMVSVVVVALSPSSDLKASSVNFGFCATGVVISMSSRVFLRHLH